MVTDLPVIIELVVGTPSNKGLNTRYLTTKSGLLPLSQHFQKYVS